MKENRKPAVVLEHYDFDSASDIQQFNSRSDDHKLYINMSPKCKNTVSDKSQLEKNFYLKKSSRKTIRNGDSPVNDVPKRVSFSNRSRILYFNKDTDDSYSEIIVDNGAHTSLQPLVDPSSSTESKDSEISSEDKQFHPLEKDLIIVLEKLPVDLVKQVEKENSDLGECFQSGTLLSDSQNFNENSDSMSTESQVSELTKSAENIMSNDKKELTSTNSSSELNTCLHQELKVSIQRLPKHLLELHLNNNSHKSFKGNLNTSKEEDSYDEDLSLTENKMTETEVNDLSLLQHPALDTDSDSSHCTPSETLRQGSCEHDNGVCNCELAIRNPCVLIKRLNEDDHSSHCTQNEPQKQVSCQQKISMYNSDIPIKNTSVLDEALNEDVNLLNSNGPLKQEPCEYESNVCDSDVPTRSSFVLNEALNGQANSLHSTQSISLKQEPCKHESNVHNFDVSVTNPCLSNEALNADVISSYSTQSESLKQEFCDDENNVYNFDVSTNSSVPNEDVISPYPAPSEPMKQKSCNHENNIFNSDVSIKNPHVLLERLELIVPNIDSNQSPEKFQKRKVNDKEIFYNEQDDINGNLVETESNIVLGSTDKHLVESSKLSKTSNKRPNIKSGSAGNNPKCLSNTVKASSKKSKSQLEDRNKTSISLNDIPLPPPKVAEVIPVDSHNLSCETNVMKQCNLKLTKTKHLSKSQIRFKHTKPSLSKNSLQQKSYQYNTSESSSEDEIPLANWPKQSSYLETLTGNSDEQILEKNSSTEHHSSEDEIPLANWSKQSSYLETLTGNSDEQILEKNSSTEHHSSEDEIPLANWSKQSSYLETLTGNSDKQILEKNYSTEHHSSMSDYSSSEDDIALSLLSKPKDVENTNDLCNQEKNTFPLSYLKNSSNIAQSSGISNLYVSEMSTSIGNQCHLPNFTSSNDDMPLSLVHDLNNVKQTKIASRVKKKKRLQKSKTIELQRFTDCNETHMADVMPSNSLTFKSDFIKKVKKTPTGKKIESKKTSNEGMLLFSSINDMNNIKQMKVSGHIEKKIEKTQSKARKRQKFTDANVMHAAEMIPPNSLSFISNVKKKVKKSPSSKQIKRKKLSNKGMPLFSSLNDKDNVKQTKISGNGKKKKRSQKSKTSGMQNFRDSNVVHVVEKVPPIFLSFKSDFKKKVKKIERKTPPKGQLLSFSCSSEIDSLEFLAQGKECNLKNPLKSGAKKHKNELFLQPKQTKLNCVKSTLVSHDDQASNSKNNSALHLKTISDNCYYETVESDTDCDIVPPLKIVKLDNYKLSCNMYEANKDKSTVAPIKNGTVTKKSRKKKDCQSKNKKTSNELHISLRNYLNKFFTEFDSLGVSKKREISFSQQEDKMVKKKERIYKMLISEMFHHLKNTCSLKKSYKSQRLTEKLNKKSPGQLLRTKLKDNFPSISTPTKGNSQKREGNKENHTNKFKLGFLTGDDYLKLYNRCVAAERLILLKYKMKKEQKKKIKRFFKTLKKNSLKKD